MSEEKRDGGKQPGFKVSDRRSFADATSSQPPATGAPAATDDSVASGGSSVTASPDSTGAAAGAPDAAASGGGAAANSEINALPPVDFHTFILSLGSSALLHLGELDDPDGGGSRPDLRMAKHTIDIIGMLQEKTRGNLTGPEERLIESLLFDLRLRYVERGKRQ